MVRARLLHTAATVCAALLVLAGCNENKPAGKATHAEGTVTLDGKPLANVNIQFFPEAAGSPLPGSAALTDDRGHFVLVTADGRDGAVVGKHAVVVRGERADERSGKPGTVKMVPDVYTQLGPANPLGTLEVTEGRQTYDLTLKTR